MMAQELQSNMKRIRELTEQLTSWEPKATYGNIVDMTMEYGEARLWGLLKNEDIAVCNTFIAKESFCAMHAHKETEVFIVYRGEMRVKTDERAFILKAGDSMYLNPYEPHEVFCPVDTWLIAVTIPACAEFPNAE